MKEVGVMRPQSPEPVSAARETVERFEQFLSESSSQDRLFELIEGQITEKVPTREHGIIAANFVTELNLWQRLHGSVGYAAVEARHRPPGDPYNDRLPDVSLVFGFDHPVETQGPALYMPDVCIEIQPPDNTPRQMSDKALFDLSHGTKLVWLVYPAQRMIEVLTATDRYFVQATEVLEGGDLLPGFAVAVAQFFPTV
jgi:Uma2 family endonuclease